MNQGAVGMNMQGILVMNADMMDEDCVAQVMVIS